MCLDLSDYKTIKTEGGLQILEKKPIWEQHFSSSEILSLVIVVALIVFAIYGIILIIFGGYKSFTKDKTIKLKGKKQIKRGVKLFTAAFIIWLLINILTAFFGVDTLCMSN